MPSQLYNSTMLSSPRRPLSTMRILSSAENLRRVALRISRTIFSTLCGARQFLSVVIVPSGIQ